MQSNMGITEEAAAEALERTQQAFDSVAKLGGSSGYLVGDRFTVADLTCASLLMPAVAVAEWGGPQEPATAKISAWLARWAEHPGAEWVREMYRRHRRM
jgi:glutathione S-transferase